MDGKSVRVCKKFFIATLGIGIKTVDYALKRKQATDSPIKDKRGTGTYHNKTPEVDIERIHAHIDSFPAMESHYARKDSNRKFLSNSLNICKMYDLYVKECQLKGKRAVKHHKYRDIFCNEYNLSFHVPKEDQCINCNDYNTKKEAGTLDSKDEKNHQDHMERKQRGRQEKQKDKEDAQKYNHIHTATFDLEAVLPTPCSLVSQAYYKGTCFLWNETEGQRGSCEIAKCLHLYLNSLNPCTEQVTLFSDSCIGQNRNKFVASALLHAVFTSTYLKVVNHKFLEPGHIRRWNAIPYISPWNMRKGKLIYMFRVSGIPLRLWQEEATLIQSSLLDIQILLTSRKSIRTITAM